jgi:hypothetical protein
MKIRSTPKVLPVLAGVLAPSLAYAIFDGGWNVDFNSDTPGQPPATADYTNGAVNTAPQSIETNAVDTVLVSSSFAGLDDQPVVITNMETSTNAGIPALEFQAVSPTPWPENGGPGISVFEWDMSIASGDNGGNRIFTVRFQAGGGLLFAISLKGVNASGVGNITMDFGHGSGLNKNVSWAHNDPMHIRVEIDKNTDRYRIWWDNSFHANELVQDRPDPDGGLAGFNVVVFEDAGGTGDNPVEFEVAVDNFVTPEYIVPAVTPVPSVAAVEFESVQSVVYTLQATTDLIGGLFDPVGIPVSGTGNLMSLYDEDTSTATKSYQIVGN